MSNEKKQQKKQAAESRVKKMGLLYTLLVAVAGIAIVWCLICIQAIDGKMWNKRSGQLEHVVRVIPAERGTIYSSDGTVLMSNITYCELKLDFGRKVALSPNTGDTVWDAPRKMRTQPIIEDSTFDKYIDTICLMLERSSAQPQRTALEYKQHILKGKAKGARCYHVAKRVPYSTWMRIRQLDRGWRACVVTYVTNEDGSRTSVVRNERTGTYGNLAHNVLGYYNGRERDTYTGLEGYYDSILRGQDGKVRCRQLSRGMFLPDRMDDTLFLDSMLLKPVIHGSHIISTIDSRYQDIAETSLRKMLSRYNGTSGCAVLMEIETGYVLACANLTLDTQLHQYWERPYSNVAVSHIYEPGSTFKSVVLTAMLNDTVVDTSMRIRTGYKNYGSGGEITDSRGHSTPDTQSVKNAFIHSSNVGMAELGLYFYRDNRSRLLNAMKEIFPYGTDMKIHLDLNDEESSARIVDPNRSLSDFLHLCYGYSTMVSPMQVLTFYNALASKTQRMVKPLFCKAIIKEGDTMHIRPQVIKEHICSPQTAALMTDLLTHVVEEGTATNLKNDTYLIAGKTGTANTRYGGNKGEMNNGSFVGFFPADNPKYSCIVLGEGIGQNNGRQTAVVFKEIADCVMAMDKSMGYIALGKLTQQMDGRNIKRDPSVVKGRQAGIQRAYTLLGLPYLSADSTSLWSYYTPAIDSLHIPALYTPYSLPEHQIPDCTGMTAREAVALLKQMGLKVRLSGTGRVKSQTPRGHSIYRENTLVTLELSN